MNALDLFHECLQHPERLVDEFYCHDELIISPSQDHPATPVMQTWTEVRERITAAKVALQDEDQDAYDRCVARLDHVLTSRDNVNFLEFTSFFPVMNVSYSMYRKLPTEDRKQFLDTMLRTFIAKRHDIYGAHGYSASTIQVRKDFEKHKSQGNFGNEKLRHILEQFQYREAPVESGSKTFCFIDDATGKRSLERLQADGASWYAVWSAAHQGKQADVIFRSDNAYYICEAKHVKEGGGGQDKQIAEIISFTNIGDHKTKRNDVFYVSFLDGVYFNKLATAQRGKVYEQRAQIEAALGGGAPSYFINTYGLCRLLQSI